MGNFQLTMLITGFLLGTSIMYIPILGLSNQEMWLSALIGWALGLTYVYFISRIKQPPSPLLFVSALLGVYSLYLAIFSTRKIGEMINITILPMTPQIYINSILVALAAYGVIKGIEVIGRLSTFFVLTAWITGTLLIFMSIPAMKITNLLPLFEHNYKIILKEAVDYANFPFMETVVFLPLLKLSKNPTKALVAGALLAGTMLLHAFIIFLLVLPPETIKKIISPTFLTISTIPSGEFVRAFIVIIWMQTGFLKVAVLIYVACTQLSEAFKINYRSIVLPISVIVISFSMLIYDNIIIMFYSLFDIYPYYAIPIQLFIPILYVIANRRMKLKNNSG